MRVLGALLATALVTGCASSKTEVRDLGGGAHAIFKRSGLANLRSNDLKVQASEDALAFCKARGQALTMLDTQTNDPDPPDFSTATVQFRCVPP